MRVFSGSLQRCELWRGSRRSLFRASRKPVNVSLQPVRASSRGGNGTSVQVTERTNTTSTGDAEQPQESVVEEVVAQTTTNAASAADNVAAAPQASEFFVFKFQPGEAEPAIPAEAPAVTDESVAATQQPAVASTATVVAESVSTVLETAQAAASSDVLEGEAEEEGEEEKLNDTTLARPAVQQATYPRNVVFVTSEVAPWSKTGGLGDVCGSLPQALAARGHRVMVITPRYAIYKEAFDTTKRISVLGTEVGLFHAVKEGVDFIFVDHPCYPRPGGIYSDEHGDYGDNQYRYTLLCMAALEIPLQLDVPGRGIYGQDITFIANDWHASLVPVYLASKYRPYGVYSGARTVLAIHNLRYQGVFPPYTFNSLGLPGNWYGALEYQYPPHERKGSYEEQGRSVNHLKAGIVTADRIVTVSPGYAQEIKTYLGGWGMDGILTSREYVLNGIVNGIDDMDWNPATDRHIPFHYTVDDFLEGKKKNKRALQQELGLPVDDKIPMVAFIGRLDYQKGADLVLQAAPWIAEQGVQLVCLGSGAKDLENGLKWLEGTYRDSARGWVGFNVAFSHKLTAAADILLMPSRFEPCGLNQLYAMRYGTVPIAHKTGGLKDTVIPFDPWQDKGTGWVFDNCDVEGLKFGLGSALHTLRCYEEDFRKLQVRGMSRNFSWDQAAQQYEQVFDWAAFDKPFCQ